MAALTPDWTDACARAEILRGAYFRLLSGQAETTVRYARQGTEREVRYAAADREGLLTALREAEAECAASLGEPLPARIRTIRFATSKGL